MSLVGYEYDDTSSTPKKKKEKPKTLKRASTSLVEYLPEEYDNIDMTGQDSEVIIENHTNEEEYDSEEDDDSQEESPLEDPFMDNFLKDSSLKSSDFTDIKSSSDMSYLKTSDSSFLKLDNSLKISDNSIRLTDSMNSPNEESPSKRLKTIDHSEWKNDYEGPTEPPCPILVSKVADYIQYKRTGTNINREYRRKKEFKNPNILEKLVEYYHIIEVGSNYPSDKFNPHKWKPSSFYDALDEEQQKCYEKIEKEKNDTKSSSKHHKSSASTAVSKNHKSSSKSHSRRSSKEREKYSKKEKDSKYIHNTSKSQWDVGAEKENG